MLYKLDEKGFAQLSKAITKLLEQAEKIEASAAERIAKDPHAEGIGEAGLGILFFDAVRLSTSAEAEGRKPAQRRKRANAVA